MKKIKIERTKKGFPALWEQGGGYTNTGEAQIIASSTGGPKKPVYIRRAGSLANGQHALIILEKNDFIIRTYHHREDFEIFVYQVKVFELGEDVALTELKYEFSRGEWNEEPPAELEQAVHTAMHKATCYHCREPHFAIV